MNVIHSNKVVAFETQQAKLKSIIPRKENSVIGECWSLISARVGESLPLFFSRLDDDLFKLSETAETNQTQAVFFEAMRYIRRERAGIQTQYMESLSRKYDEYWSQAYIKEQKRESPPVAGNEENLILIDNAELEESLAISCMIEKGNSLFHAELFPLNERFCSLLETQKEISTLPVSPDTLCKAFDVVLQSLTIELNVKLIVYKIFERTIVGNIGQLYSELNSHLAENGVLPSITRNIKRQASSDSSEQTSHKLPLSEQLDGMDAAAYIEAFRTMQSMMDGWRLQLGMPIIPAEALADAVIVDSREVLGALNTLQAPSDGAQAGGQPMSGESLKQYVTHQLGTLKDDNKTRALGRPEEDIIDMVGMLFDFILDDTNLSAPIKGLVARLQIPVIKVAILDKSFFAKKDHPARALLNGLAQAGIGLGAAEADAGNLVIQKVEEIVGRVLHEFNQDVELFAELLEDLTAFTDKDFQRSKIAEDRTRQVTQSKEKVWLAKKAVASEITLRLQNRETSSAVQSFLYNDWKDVLVLAYLRQDKMDGEWERALAIMDKLIWSITPASNANERQEVIRAIPILLKSIKESLESISLGPHQIAAVMKDLEVAHMSALRSLAPAKNSAESVDNNNEQKVLPIIEVEIKDAELVEAINEIKSLLPDISNVDVEEVIMGNGGAVWSSGTQEQQIDHAQSVYLELVGHLNVGDWLEFIDEDGKAWRAKLSWKSTATSRCVFVNRRGVKALELKFHELSSRLREGKARVIENASTPLMDRALSFLTQTLKNPFAKSAQPSVST